MWHVEHTTDGIGERMHGGHRCIGKRLAGQHGAQQHGLARRQVAAIAAGREQVAGQQRQRLGGQHVGQGIFQQAAGVRFDRMHHGVDAGGGRHAGRQAQGQAGVEDGQVRIQLRRDHTHLAGGARGDDGDVRHFRTRAGRGRQLHQGQALAMDIADAIQLRQFLVPGGQHGDQLGHVQRAAATEADNQFHVKHLRLGHAGQHDGFGGIGLHLIKDVDLDPRRLQAVQRSIGQACTQEAHVGDEQGAAHGREVMGDVRAQLAGGAGFNDQMGHGTELEGGHADS